MSTKSEEGSSLGAESLGKPRSENDEKSWWRREFYWKLLGLLLVVAFILLLYILLELWPQPIEAGAAPSLGSEISFFDSPHLTFWISSEVQLPLLALTGGALGGVIMGLKALSKHFAQGDLERKWYPWYILRPFIGAGLGVAIYLLFRAGLTENITVDVINPLAVAGLAIMIGIFAEEAMIMLRGIAAVLFAKPSKVGRIYYSGQAAPVSGYYKAVHTEKECPDGKGPKWKYALAFQKTETIGKCAFCDKPVEWELIQEI